MKLDVEESRNDMYVSGKGEPVLLLHCSSSTNVQWRSLSDSLCGEFRVFAPDQWGCGESDPWSGEGPFTLSNEAAPLLHLIRQTGTSVHVVAHSYGGGVALHIARQHPQLLRSLTLIEPSAFHLLRDSSASDWALFDEIKDIAECLRNAVIQRDPKAGMMCFMDYWNGEGAWAAMPEKTQCKLLPRLDKAVLDFEALFYEPADLAAYAGLPHSTLILCGDKSPAPSRRIVEMLVSAMPNARLKPVVGANHMSPITHPDEVNRAIRSHLSRNRHSPTPRLAA